MSVRLAQLVRLARRVQKVLLGPLVLLVRRDLQARLAPRGRQGRQVQGAPRVRLVPRGRQGRQGRVDMRARQGQKVTRATSEI